MPRFALQDLRETFHDMQRRPAVDTVHGLCLTEHCHGFCGASCMERLATEQAPVGRIEFLVACGSAGETGGRTGEV